MLIYLLFPCIAASKAQWARTTNSKRHQRLQAHGPTIRSSKSRSANCNQQRHPSNIATRDIKVTEFFVKLNPIGTWYLRFISPTYNPSMHHSDSQQKKSSNDPPAGNKGRTAMDESNAILAQILRAESCTQTLAFLVTLVEFLCCRPECLWLDECDGFWCQTVSDRISSNTSWIFILFSML